MDTYTLAAGAVDQSVIVAPADYRTATSLENEATLIRLHGSMQIANLSTTLYSTVVLCLIKYQEGFAAPLDPANQANLQNGDVLWTKILGLEPLAAASSLSNMSIDNIDVKTKRKLSSLPEGEDIRMVVSNVAGGGSISVIGLFRALLLLKV